MIPLGHIRGLHSNVLIVPADNFKENDSDIPTVDGELAFGTSITDFSTSVTVDNADSGVEMAHLKTAGLERVDTY